MRLLLASVLLCGVAQAQYTAGLTPTCPSTAQNTHKLKWMDRPEVVFQWCPGPNNTIDHWLTMGGAPADNEIAADILIRHFEPQPLVTRGKQTVMQADAKGVLTPFLIAGVAQTVTVGPRDPCRGPGIRLKGPFGSEVLYSVAGRYSDQGNLLPGEMADAVQGITLPAVLVWCTLTNPPTAGW